MIEEARKNKRERAALGVRQAEENEYLADLEESITEIRHKHARCVTPNPVKPPNICNFAKRAGYLVHLAYLPPQRSRFCASTHLPINSLPS
jgi:hypothetical protein